MKRYIFSLIRGIGYGLGFALFGFLINSCEVNAQNISFDSCNYYSSSSSGTGSLSTYSVGNNTWYRCESPSGLSGKQAVRYNFNGVQHSQSGYGIVSFLYTAPVNTQLVSASLQTSGNQFTCSVSTGYTYVDFADGNISYAIFCNNIPLYGNQNFIFRLNLNGNGNNASFGLLNTSVNFYSDQQIANNIINNQNSINNSINDVNDSIKDDTVNQDKADSFFSNFESNEHGLTGIITAPLSLIQQFNSNTCTPLSFQIKGKTAQLPCGDFIFGRSDMQQFLNVYNIIVGGLIAYGACRGIFKYVQDFKNPDNSKVEVLDL